MLGNCLLPDTTNPSPEPMLTSHQLSSMAFIGVHCYKRYLSHQSLKKNKPKLFYLKCHSNLQEANELIHVTKIDMNPHRITNDCHLCLRKNNLISWAISITRLQLRRCTWQLSSGNALPEFHIHGNAFSWIKAHDFWWKKIITKMKLKLS